MKPQIKQDTVAPVPKAPTKSARIENPKRTIKPYSISNGKPAITLAVGMTTPDGMEFDPKRDHSYCRICGTVYQTQPAPNTAQEVLDAELLRRRWSQKHARLHTTRQHRQLAQSGMHCTPEALVKLAPLGIIPVSDIVLSDESEHAGLTAPRMPTTDAED